MKGIRILILPCVWFLLRIFLAQSQSTSEECREFEYTCDSGQCVNNTVQCDGTKDCEDGSDETHFLCRQLDVTCSSPSVFRCAYGACIDKDRLCNGVKDCADNSDELHPECYKEFLASVHKNSRCDPIYNFTCHSGECVDSIALCDGYFDCKDKSDESLIECFNMTCQPNAFQCAYGACIDGYPDPKCNGTNECHDGSDELPKYCPNIPTQIGSEDGPQCLLPEQPKFGKYMIGGCESGGDPDFCESEPGTPVVEGVHLIYECERGYNLPLYSSGESAFQSVCLSKYDSPLGEWNIDITCRKNCEPIFSETLDLECLYDEKKVPCDLDVRAGTILKPRCKPFYHPLEPVTVYESTMCLDAGKWRDPLYTCVPDSGAKNLTSQKPNEPLATENPNQSGHESKECHSNFPPMSDRELLCLALLNAGVSIKKFQGVSSKKATETGQKAKSGQSGWTRHSAEMAKISDSLSRLMNFNVYFQNQGETWITDRSQYSCYESEWSDNLLKKARKHINKINNTIKSIQAQPQPEQSAVQGEVHSNALQEELHRKMGNNFQDAIRQCKIFARNGMENLLHTLQ